MHVYWGATIGHPLRKPSLIAGHLPRLAQVPSAIHPWPLHLPVPGLWQHICAHEELAYELLEARSHGLFVSGHGLLHSRSRCLLTD